MRIVNEVEKTPEGEISGERSRAQVSANQSGTMLYAASPAANTQLPLQRFAFDIRANECFLTATTESRYGSLSLARLSALPTLGS
jgi:hypothetical protein